MPLPSRKHLPHDPPLWINPANEIWFITVCCVPRWRNQLALDGIWPFLVESVTHRNKSRTWFAHLFLAMPDHCHALLSFPPEQSMKRILELWKRWVATQRGVDWQVDFFDHRLRNEDQYVEKYDYILQNPVRAGLVEEGGVWPYSWRPPGALPFARIQR